MLRNYPTCNWRIFEGILSGLEFDSNSESKQIEKDVEKNSVVSHSKEIWTVMDSSDQIPVVLPPEERLKNLQDVANKFNVDKNQPIRRYDS